MRLKLSRNPLRLAIAAGAVIGLAGAAVAAAPNWLATFTLSAKGGHVVGNPAAATRIVEYASYTCGHCAHFEADEAPQLKALYVSKGKVSFEVRNLVRDPLDLTAALLARCGGKGRFFGNHKHLMATQATWVGNAEKISAATEAKLETNDYGGFMQGAYIELGLVEIMAQRGVTAAQGKACLADKVALKQVLAMTEEAGQLGINATPGFTINGTVRDVHDLASFKPYLPK